MLPAGSTAKCVCASTLLPHACAAFSHLTFETYFLQDVVEAQLAAGELPAETASALRRMRAELQATDARQKVGDLFC